MMEKGLTTDPSHLHSLTDDQQLAAGAVREAGAIALRFFRHDPKTWKKDGDSIVTEADIAVNDLLRERLGRARPDYGWLSEETEDDAGRLARERVWVVDPIDGTSDFAKGKRHFCISVALVEAGRPVLGVLFAPAIDEFLEAREGQGARCNGASITTSHRDTIEGCRMAAYGPMFKHPAWREKWPEMEIIDPNSVAYRIAMVAKGAADASMALNSKNDWDLAAADVIVREAGGEMTTHRGERLVYNLTSPRHRSFVAAGPELHALLLGRLRDLKLRGE